MAQDQTPEEAALDNTLALNPVVGFSMQDIVKAGALVARQALLQPAIGLEHGTRLFQENVRILFGNSEIGPNPRDRRFSDAAFKSDNGIYRRLAQSWSAWQQNNAKWVDAVGFNDIDRERARFIVDLVTDALAPTNFLLGNPSALKRARETRGRSLFQGVQNFVDDLVNNGGMPAQVDKSPFKVGENIANTPGKVVFRCPVAELIQYAPTTDEVQARPIFIVPPQINKFYVYDMSPEKSLVRYLVEAGFQVFMVSWRNPTEEHRDWGLAEYVDALEQAIDATLEITDADSVDSVGACAGGITLTTAIAYLTALDRGDKVASLTLMVNVLENQAEDSVTGLFMTDEAIEAARKRSAQAGVLDGQDTARIFNWMRPNDLIWNYVVANYLHGETPPAFDILYWNNDTTRLPARLHSDFLNIFKDAPFKNPGVMLIRDVPIDLTQVKIPVFITGGTTDHITPWHACYRSTQLFGGECTYLLSTAGHIQSLINPPGPSKRKYYTNSQTPPSAEEWRKDAEEHAGTWWPYWTDWLKRRNNRTITAPPSLGSPTHAAIEDAPGAYVHE